MEDALEILDEIENIITNHADLGRADLEESLVSYISSKRYEFMIPKGDCCG